MARADNLTKARIVGSKPFVPDPDDFSEAQRARATELRLWLGCISWPQKHRGVELALATAPEPGREPSEDPERAAEGDSEP